MSKPIVFFARVHLNRIPEEALQKEPYLATVSIKENLRSKPVVATVEKVNDCIQITVVLQNIIKYFTGEKIMKPLTIEDISKAIKLIEEKYSFKTEDAEAFGISCGETCIW